jgi:frataxin-like iron-binding protein CyaY
LVLSTAAKRIKARSEVVDSKPSTPTAIRKLPLPSNFIPSNGGGSGGGSRTQPQQLQRTIITQPLRDTAKTVVGHIRRVEERGGKITFIGQSGKRFTPSLQRLARTGAISQQELQGRLGSGSIAAIEKAIDKRTEDKSQENIMRVKLAEKKQLLIRQQDRLKKIKATTKKDSGVNAFVLQQRKIFEGKEGEKLKALEKDIRNIKGLEEEAARRSEAAADIFKKIPFLGGENFVQQTARALLALPVRATVGVGEQLIISGFKLSTNIKALQLESTREKAKGESLRAIKTVPITLVKSYDPRTPEGLANIIATVVAFKFAKASTKNIKGTAAKTVKTLAKKAAKTKNPGQKAFLKKTAKTVNKLKNKPSFIKKVKNSVNSIKKAVKKKVAEAKVKKSFLKEAKAGRIARMRLLKGKTTIPKPKRTFQIKLKRGPKAKLRRIKVAIKKPFKSIKSVLKNINKKAKRVDVRIEKGVNKITSIVAKQFNKLSRIKQLQVKRAINTFERINKPTVRQVKLLSSKISGLTKKGIKITGKVAKKGIRKVDTGSFKKITQIDNAVNRVLNKAGLKFKVLGKGTKSITSPLIKRIGRDLNSLNKILKKTKGKLTKVAKLKIKALEKKLPFKVKLVKKAVSKPKLERLTGKRFRKLKGPKPRITTRGILKQQKIQAIRAARLAKKSGKIRPTSKGFAFEDKVTGKITYLKSRKQFLRLIKRQEGRTTQSSSNLIKNAESFRKGVQKRFKTEGLKKVADDYKGLTKKRIEIKQKIIETKKNPFSSKSRLTELKRLNQADKNAASTQNQLQQHGQKTVQILQEKQITNLRKQVIPKAPKSKLIKTKNTLVKIKNKLTSQLKSTKKLGLTSTSNKIAKQVSIMAVLINRANTIAKRTGIPKRQVVAITKQKQEQKQKQKQTPKQEQEQKQTPKVKEETIVVPNVRIDNLPKERQNQIVNTIIASIIGTRLIRTAGGKKVIPQTRLRGPMGNFRNYIFNKLSRKKFVFTPDIYSIIFGIKAKAGQKIKLLKIGRIFTGTERRAIVK